MENSEISWTHNTFNPWIGCNKVSPGCKFCYAEADMDKRRGRAKWGIHGTRSVTSDNYWKEPIKWNRDAAASGERRRVFCASLADVFEGWEGTVGDNKGNDLFVSGEPLKLRQLRQNLFELIESTPNLDWLLLTKRPENIMAMVPTHWKDRFPDNVWIGTSVENQEAANNRIPHLLKVPAKIRFLSMEPLLGPVEFSDITKRSDALLQLGKKALHGIHWVIVGGESGHNARPMHPDWARSIRDQCEAAGVPFHFKQFGEWGIVEGAKNATGKSDIILTRDGEQWVMTSDPTAVIMDKVGKKISGNLLDGELHLNVPTI